MAKAPPEVIDKSARRAIENLRREFAPWDGKINAIKKTVDEALAAVNGMASKVGEIAARPVPVIPAPQTIVQQVGQEELARLARLAAELSGRVASVSDAFPAFRDEIRSAVERAEGASNASLAKAAAALSREFPKPEELPDFITRLDLDGEHLFEIYRSGKRRDVGRIKRTTIHGGGRASSAQIAAWESASAVTDLTESEFLDDQTSTGSVLTFTFSAAVQKAWVELKSTGLTDTAEARVRTDGGTPDSDTGAIIHAGSPMPFVGEITTVKVLADSGKIVGVYGYRK